MLRCVECEAHASAVTVGHYHYHGLSTYLYAVPRKLLIPFKVARSIPYPFVRESDESEGLTRPRGKTRKKSVMLFTLANAVAVHFDHGPEDETSRTCPVPTDRF